MSNINKLAMTDNTFELLKCLLEVLDIKVTRSMLLQKLHKHYASKNSGRVLSEVLNELNIESTPMSLSFEHLGDIPLPAVVILQDMRDDDYIGRYYILLNRNENGVELLDTVNNGKIFMPYSQVKDKWASVVTVLEYEEATDEVNYEQKTALEKKKISEAGGVSVIMPVFNQASYVSRAISSLLLQSYDKWELILIDDGSTDNFESVVKRFLDDGRIRYIKNEINKGLGHCLNIGLEAASYDMIAYLPSDDIYFKDHLKSLVETIAATDSDLVYSGLFHECNHHEAFSSSGIIEGDSLQLVQVLHRKTNDRWIERSELVTNDLDRMFWNKFQSNNRKTVGTRCVTCEWVKHSKQRHLILDDSKGGGIYLYKKTYGVSEPIRFQTKVGNYIDEIEHFKDFRKKALYDAENGLKILLVGELAFNPERICALEERGHKLYGLWMEAPVNFNTIGPLPFGNVEDIPLNNWVERVKEIKPNIIYALLNYQAVPLAHHVLMNNPGIPFVWHFKEGPFYCRTSNMWDKLVQLYARSDGRIYNNEMIRDWFGQFIPSDNTKEFILDGDLPQKEWFTENRSRLLSDDDNEIHTVVAGRPMGIFPMDIKYMAEQKIHLHIYGNIFHNQFKKMIGEARKLAPKYLHLHPNCPQEEWVKEFSKYDAGWLHFFRSNNNGELMKASWHDLNSPARMSTYAMAGLPMLMPDNNGHRVAAQELLEKEGMALLFDSINSLGKVFGDRDKIKEIRSNVWNKKYIFCFDSYADDLIGFFRRVIDEYKHEPQ